MWIYAAYRWPDEAAFTAALVALGWHEGTPPWVDLLPSGTLYLPPADDDGPGDAIAGWHVAAAFRDHAPLAEWASMEIEPPDVMPVLGRAPVPDRVTNFQARAVLMQTPTATPGVSLFRAIDDTLRAGKDTADGAIGWQAWEQANDFYRDGGLINTLGAQFGLTSGQIDALFRRAAAVVA